VCEVAGIQVSQPWAHWCTAMDATSAIRLRCGQAQRECTEVESVADLVICPLGGEAEQYDGLFSHR